jgi:ATP-binding cassette subfamily C (CFTR/MRP) protein 1
MTNSVDHWELPQPQLTSAFTDETEKNFYSRCPPEMRPRFMNIETQNVLATISQTSLPSKDTAGDTENDKQEYEPDMEKVCWNRPTSHKLL